MDDDRCAGGTGASLLQFSPSRHDIYPESRRAPPLPEHPSAKEPCKGGEETISFNEASHLSHLRVLALEHSFAHSFIHELYLVPTWDTVPGARDE